MKNIEKLNTIDFLSEDGSVVFRTCEEEHSKLVFQVVNIYIM